MVSNLEDALNWRPVSDMYGTNISKDRDTADAWKPAEYNLIDWKGPQELEKIAKIEERKRDDKRRLIKACIVCGTGLVIAAVPLVYHIAQCIPDIGKYGLNWPF
ncbi:hypothetical protein KY333_02950 [Candidatus Woesearchaeota archaeon]|nr:hypothetical protein [Candidatus Woesearchaeota archaeon]MBW2993876.1 hypothetical protein [Candidatus Woesearchaeota archaeon]